MEPAMKYFIVFIFATLLSGLATADECTIDLKYNVKVSPEALIVSNETETLYQIQQGGFLTLKSEPVELDEKQRALAEEYAGEVAVASE